MTEEQLQQLARSAEDFSVVLPIRNQDLIAETNRVWRYEHSRRPTHPDFKDFYKWKTGRDLIDGQHPVFPNEENGTLPIIYYVFNWSGQKIERGFYDHHSRSVIFTFKK